MSELRIGTFVDSETLYRWLTDLMVNTVLDAEMNDMGNEINNQGF